MGVATRAKKKRLEVEEPKKRLEEEEERLEEDRISRLPDGVLGDIVSLLPTKDGVRTQVLSSRWRPIWLSAPLNLDIYSDPTTIPPTAISRVLSSHPGPGRRFSIHMRYVKGKDYFAAKANLDGWLRSPALNNLQELDFHLGFTLGECSPPPLPASARRFSCTLRVASFGCCGFPDGNASVLHLPLLKQLSLVNVKISETSLHALLTGCSVLESLLLLHNYGFPRVQIVSSSLRSIGVFSCRLQQLIIQDAPCLERLLFFRAMEMEMDISVISAPRLKILGKLSSNVPRLQFGTTAFQGSSIVNLTTVVRSVKVLALTNVNLSLDAVINLMKCFPCVDKLYIKTADVGQRNVWYHKYRNLIGTLDIQLKKIVLAYYRGNKSHINFAKFFVSNARVLGSMRFELRVENISSVWIERQHRLLQIEKRASRGAQFDFVPRNQWIGSLGHPCSEKEQVHDLSTADPFQRFH